MTADLATLRVLAMTAQAIDDAESDPTCRVVDCESCARLNLAAALLLACDEIAALRETVTRLNRRAQAAEAAPPFPKTRARAQRRRHDEEAARGMLAGMSTPTLTEFAAIATAALRDSSAAWNGMSDAEKDAIKARVRYGLDYLATQHGIEPGDIYSAGPGDPPPTAPAA